MRTIYEGGGVVSTRPQSFQREHLLRSRLSVFVDAALCMYVEAGVTQTPRDGRRQIDGGRRADRHSICATLEKKLRCNLSTEP